jgi:hypothetical protein
MCVSRSMGNNGEQLDTNVFILGILKKAALSRSRAAARQSAYITSKVALQTNIVHASGMGVCRDILVRTYVSVAAKTHSLGTGTHRCSQKENCAAARGEKREARHLMPLTCLAQHNSKDFSINEAGSARHLTLLRHVVLALIVFDVKLIFHAIGPSNTNTRMLLILLRTARSHREKKQSSQYKLRWGEVEVGECYHADKGKDRGKRMR